MQIDKIKINILLHNLYNEMNKTEKEKFKNHIILLSKELLGRKSLYIKPKQTNRNYEQIYPNNHYNLSYYANDNGVHYVQ